MYPKSDRISPFLLSALITLVGFILVVGLATKGSFNPFEPGFLWRAYNYYFLSLIDGRLDVPAFAISKEGSFIDGKAYMYYGLLPAITRFLVMPFVDLTTTPTAYFSIFLFTLVGNGVLQYALVKHLYVNKVVNEGWTRISQVQLVIVSLILWFGSANFMISQNATLYHEPYAASLCLFNIYIALLILRGFFIESVGKPSLLPFALLAGLCVHARMPSALALYLVTGGLMLWLSAKYLREQHKTLTMWSVVRQSLINYWREILLLTAFGISIMVLNYLRYGDALNFMGRNYGFIFFEGFSERMCNVLPQSDFYKVFRIIINGYVYLTGDWQNHWSLIRLFETGYGRVEGPVIPVGLLWLLPVLCYVALIWVACRCIKSGGWLLLLFILAFSAGAIFQLTYPTIAHRYIATLWLPLGAGLFFYFFLLTSKAAPQFVLTGQTHKSARVLLFAAILGAGYQLILAASHEYYLQDGPIFESVEPNYNYSDEHNQYLAELTNDKISLFYQQRKEQRDAACARWREQDAKWYAEH